jgi:phosphate starvation-inducible PhoH-like protein
MSKKPSQSQRSDTTERARLEVTFDRPHLLGALFGQYDQNLVAIENRLGVYIAARGNKLQIEGEAEAAARARDVMTGLYNRIAAGQEIDSGAVEAVIAMSAEPTLDGIIRHDVAEPPKVMIRTRKKTIVPRSATQVTYMEALSRNDIIFALGPAGTGKTYLAVAQAVSQLITGSVDRLILSRPAVEAGERLGFLPGDMKEKVDPYLRPIYDALYDTLPAEQVERRIASGEIEIAPLAFMRGRTLANAFIVLDEAQNTTVAAGGLAATGGFGTGRRGGAAGRGGRHLGRALQYRGRRPSPCRGTDRSGL